jgi:hypothetical protein
MMLRPQRNYIHFAPRKFPYSANTNDPQIRNSPMSIQSLNADVARRSDRAGAHRWVHLLVSLGC